MCCRNSGLREINDEGESFMKKSLFRWAALLALCLGLLTVTAFAAMPSVRVSGTTLTYDGNPVYAIMDSEGVLTTEGADSTNYDVKFEAVNQVPTLTLRGAVVNGIYSAWKDTLVISGEGSGNILTDGIDVAGGSVLLEGSIQSVTDPDGAAIQAGGDVTINGTVEELAGRFGAIYTIGLYDEESSFVGGDVIIRGSVGELTGTGYTGNSIATFGICFRISAAGNIEICETAQVGDVRCSDWNPESGPQGGSGLSAEKDLVIDGTVGSITGKEHGLYAGGDILIRGAVGDVAVKSRAGCGLYACGSLELTKGAQVGDVLCGDQGDGIAQNSHGVYGGREVSLAGTAGDISGNYTGIYSEGDIVISGTVGSISANENLSRAIDCADSLEIARGAQVKSITGDWHAICAGDSVTIAGAVTGTVSSADNDAIYADRGDISISGKMGEITCSGTNAAIEASAGSVTISGTVGNISSGFNTIGARGSVTISGKTGNITGSGVAIGAGGSADAAVLISGTVGNITGGNRSAVESVIRSTGDVEITEDAILGKISGATYSIWAAGDVTIAGGDEPRIMETISNYEGDGTGTVTVSGTVQLGGSLSDRDLIAEGLVVLEGGTITALHGDLYTLNGILNDGTLVIPYVNMEAMREDPYGIYLLRNLQAGYDPASTGKVTVTDVGDLRWDGTEWLCWGGCVDEDHNNRCDVCKRIIATTVSYWETREDGGTTVQLDGKIEKLAEVGGGVAVFAVSYDGQGRMTDIVCGTVSFEDMGGAWMTPILSFEQTLQAGWNIFLPDVWEFKPLCNRILLQ